MLAAVPVQTPAGLEAAFSLGDYYSTFIYMIVVFAFAAGGILASQYLYLLIKPRNDTAVKLMPYESGMDPIGDARMQFDIRFYVIAILFLIFDVELLFLYPWAATAYEVNGLGVRMFDGIWGKLIFWEIIAFLASLAVGYIYAWRKGVFQWR